MSLNELCKGRPAGLHDECFSLLKESSGNPPLLILTNNNPLSLNNSLLKKTPGRGDRDLIFLYIFKARSYKILWPIL